MQLQNVPPEQARNVRKQAEQIRFCLQQAAEYFEAAQVVSQATKPVLQYYGVMSLALAEILFKQDGGSSLDAARGENAHHGLVFKLNGKPPTERRLDKSAEMLRAQPLVKKAGQRTGTFDLWHRSAREAPMCAHHVRQLQSASNSGPAVFASGIERRFPLVPEAGISLLDCFKALPAMRQVVSDAGIPSELVRARAQVETGMQAVTLQLVIQPGPKDAFDALMPKLLFGPELVDRINIVELDKGAIVTTTTENGFGEMRVSYPNAFQSAVSDIFFCTRNESLNEFGLFYAAAFMLGNYARYHPDAWIADIERSTSLANAAATFMSAAEERAPLLVLSELSQAWHITA